MIIKRCDFLKEVLIVSPSIKHKNEYLIMMEEWKKAKEEVVPGVLNMKHMNYEGWLKLIESYKDEKTCPCKHVPSDTFFLVDSQSKIYGAVSIRHYLNEELLNFGGHIGYGVRPSERKKGYAAVMLKMALLRCRYMGINKVLVTCNKDNIGSAKTIKKNGGILENEVTGYDGKIVERYWINI